MTGDKQAAADNQQKGGDPCTTQPSTPIPAHGAENSNAAGMPRPPFNREACVKILREASDQPPAKATDDKPKEWTVTLQDDAIALHCGKNKPILFDRLSGRVVLFRLVADAHNAELAAEREPLVDALKKWMDDQANEVRERINTGLHNVEPLDAKLSAFIETRAAIDALAKVKP